MKRQKKEQKTIMLDIETWKRLSIIKINENYRNFNEIVSRLLQEKDKKINMEA